MAEKEEYEKCRMLMEMFHQQQNFYWQRFSAFATLHAALFVLVTATMIETQPRAGVFVSVLSAFLAVVWFVVQSLSLFYADEWKKPFHEVRKGLGLEPSDPVSPPVTVRIALLIRKRTPNYSSTDWAWWVPIVVFILWAVVLVLVVCA